MIITNTYHLCFNTGINMYSAEYKENLNNIGLFKDVAYSSNENIGQNLSL